VKPLSLGLRALLSALVPTALVAVLLAGIFLFGRVADLEEAHYQRGVAIGQRLAASAEFALFAENRQTLRSLAEATLRQQDVVAVSLLDRQGTLLVANGQLSSSPTTLPGTAEFQRTKLANGAQRLVLPVLETQAAVDDLYAPLPGKAVQKPLLGYVVIEISNASLDARVKSLLLAGALITLGGLLLGSVLAAELTRNVTYPIEHITLIVKEIGQGNFAARVRPEIPASTRALGEGVNRMAEQIRNAQQDLERRIADATNALREKKDEAELATRAKSRFLASASHDLRQPIHALGMFVARLRQLPHDAETAHLIGNVEKSVQAMQGLLTALLDISRLDAGSLTPELCPYPLAELFRRLAVDLSPRADEQGLNLRLRPSPLWVMSDPELLYRILLNLAANAIEYTEHGGVLVGCRRRGSRVRIEVWDTGIGIPEQSRQEIFMEFVQLDNPARERNKGLGLGLAIVQRTATLLGHPLFMRSRPQRGTCFAIEVPVVAARSQLGRRKLIREDLVSANLEGSVVLMIDDDPLSRDAMVLLLQSWGCIVRVGDGEDDMEATRVSVAPDLIVCDYRLPGDANGIALIARLRQFYDQQIPACLISGDTDAGLITAAAEAELPLLHKPVRPARLRALLNRLIRLKDTPD
jgi:signal transduction histidine kinase/CheY-like chemotaxis protein